MDNEIVRQQQAICDKYGAPYVACPASMKVGIAPQVKGGQLPLNGLREHPEDDTTGWYIWAGEGLADDAASFEPLHVVYLNEWCPQILPYLGLPPGWRFIIAGDYADVWQDDSLLNP